ncbi:MAG TPA: hypothetical protein VMV69_24280 [Pirellulales bacterium]|nr:hypothetical protein [Pirellulales bacterium]
MAKKKSAKPAKKPLSPVAATVAPEPAPTAVLPKKSFASIYPGVPSRPGRDETEISPRLVACVERLEKKLKLPVWLLVQNELVEEQELGKDTPHMIGNVIAAAFFSARHSMLKKNEKIALLIDSNGGLANSAYELAMLLRRHCGGFVSVIPRHAKSAATLLSLGADQIIMNDHAELGPLDVQVWDADREEMLSGLDEVQALEQLNTFAMGAFDKMMFLLLRRTKKKSKSIMPLVAEFVARLAEPMFEKIDVVRYTQMSRALKIAEEYAKRLLVNTYGDSAAEISRILIENYPEHGFPIYPSEIRGIGLKLAPLDDELRSTLEEITLNLSGITCVGRIQST